MSAVYLYDDAAARRFEPFALTRPAGELRAGALLVRERWTRALGLPVAGHLTSAHLRSFDEPGAAPVVRASDVPAGAWIANARFAPAIPLVPMTIESDRLMAGGRVVAVRVRAAIAADAFDAGDADLGTLAGDSSEGERELAGWWMDEVWDFIRHLVPMLETDIPVLGVGMSTALPGGAIKVGDNPVYIEAGAEIEPSVCFDTSAGPVLVRAGAHVQAFTRLVGPLYVGSGSTLYSDKIAASSVGDVCKVHGEVANTILIGYANKGHDGFVGHSILGRWVNLGAGTITSNLKNTYGTVQLWTPDGVRETGLQFLGTLFGDHAKTGIGLRLTTGTVLGAGANVFGSVMPPKAVSPFAWGDAGAFVDYRVDKFLEVAERVMGRRHVSMSTESRRQLAASYDARWRATT